MFGTWGARMPRTKKANLQAPKSEAGAPKASPAELAATDKADRPAWNTKVENYESETAALVFIRGATRPIDGQSMHRRADAREVANKILRLGDKIALAHVVYGPTDLIALVKDGSAADRRKAVGS